MLAPSQLRNTPSSSETADTNKSNSGRRPDGSSFRRVAGTDHRRPGRGVSRIFQSVESPTSKRRHMRVGPANDFPRRANGRRHAVVLTADGGRGGMISMRRCATRQIAIRQKRTGGLPPSDCCHQTPPRTVASIWLGTYGSGLRAPWSSVALSHPICAGPTAANIMAWSLIAADTSSGSDA